MRNRDIQFNREAQTVTMMRSNCDNQKGFDFNTYYFTHTDHRRTEPFPRNSENLPDNKKPLTPLNSSNQGSSSGSFMLTLLGVGLNLLVIALLAFYFLFKRRYKLREAPAEGPFDQHSPETAPQLETSDLNASRDQNQETETSGDLSV